MRKFCVCVSIAFVLLTVGLEIFFIDNRNKDTSIVEITRPCLVLDKMDSIQGRYVQVNYTLILKDTTTNKIFQLDVLPSTFSLAKPGTTFYFTLAEQNIDNYNCSPAWPIMRDLLILFIIPLAFIWGVVMLILSLWRESCENL